MRRVRKRQFKWSRNFKVGPPLKSSSWGEWLIKSLSRSICRSHVLRFSSEEVVGKLLSRFSLLGLRWALCVRAVSLLLLFYVGTVLFMSLGTYHIRSTISLPLPPGQGLNGSLNSYKPRPVTGISVHHRYDKISYHSILLRLIWCTAFSAQNLAPRRFLTGMPLTEPKNYICLLLVRLPVWKVLSFDLSLDFMKLFQVRESFREAKLFVLI